MSSEDWMKNTPWCDVQLLGLSWVEGGRDLVLHLRLPDIPGQQDDRNRILSCRWAHALVVSLAFQERAGGFPLTWDTTFSREIDDTWCVLLDFGSLGQVRFRCYEMELSVDPGD